MSDFTTKCQINPRYKKFLKQVEKGVYSINISELYAQADTIHATRLVRRMQTKQVTAYVQKTLIDAQLQNQQYRSDMVTMRQKCQRKNDLMLWHIEELSNYLKSKYAVNYKALGNQEARNAAFGTLFEQVYAISNQLVSFIDHADIIIADIDKSGWVLKGIVDILNIQTGRLPEL